MAGNTVRIDIIAEAVDRATATLRDVEKAARRVGSATKDQAKAQAAATGKLEGFFKRAEGLDKFRNQLEMVRGLFDYVVPLVEKLGGALWTAIQNADPLHQVATAIGEVAKQAEASKKKVDALAKSVATLTNRAIQSQIEMARRAGDESRVRELEQHKAILGVQAEIADAKQVEAKATKQIEESGDRLVKIHEAEAKASKQLVADRVALAAATKEAAGWATPEGLAHNMQEGARLTRQIAKAERQLHKLALQRVKAEQEVAKALSFQDAILSSLTVLEEKRAAAADTGTAKPKARGGAARPDRTKDLQRQLVLMQTEGDLAKQRLKTGWAIADALEAANRHRLRASEAEGEIALAVERLHKAEEKAADDRQKALEKARTGYAKLFDRIAEGAATAAGHVGAALQSVTDNLEAAELQRHDADVRALSDTLSNTLAPALGEVGGALDEMAQQFIDLAEGQTTVTQAITAGVGPFLTAMGAQLGAQREFAALRALIEMGLGFATIWTNPLEGAGHFAAAAALGLAAGTSVGGASGGVGGSPAASTATRSPYFQSANDNRNAGGGTVVNNFYGGVIDGQSTQRALRRAEGSATGTGWERRGGW